MITLLFVCSGNTCRSPLAEGIAKQIFSENPIGEMDIISAGSSALEGLPASALAVQVAEKNDINLTEHKARLLNKSLIKGADLIVAMSSKHKEAVGVIEPSALEYTYLLTDFCDGVDGDIPDPIGSDIEAYEKAFELIKKCVERMKNRLKTFNRWAK